MDRDDTVRERSTRREYLTYGAAVGGALLAGCTSGSESESTDSAESYTVSMAPVGDVTLPGVPEEVMVYSPLYADMMVAYGHGEAITSLGFDAEAEGEALNSYYDRLEDVSFDGSDLTQLNTGSGAVTIDKELFYELDSDLHLVDPCLVLSMEGWERADIEEIESAIAPWFGNTYSRDHADPPEECRDEYQYYTLWEIAEKVAAVFREEERYAALQAVYDDLRSEIESNLPPEDERPTVAAIIFMEDAFFPSKSDAPGFATADVRPLGAPDAFADEDVSYETSYDYEKMLEIDPDVILHRFGVATYDVDEIRRTLEDHPVAGDLTAVENDRVYASGNPVQGPITNLFQLEMAAKQLYPERFGEWPERSYREPYPEIPADERLFDRQRVAEIITGAE